MSKSSNRHDIVSYLILVGLIVASLGLLAGYFGFYRLELDILSHFRLHFVAALIVLAVAYFVPRWLGLIVIMVGALVVPLAIATQTQVLSTISPATKSPAARSKTVSIVSFNTWLRNKDWRTIAKYLTEIDADFVVLLEFGASKRQLFTELKGKYPHQIDCAGKHGCHVALLSKYRWVKAGISSVTRRTAPTVWAKFGPKLNNLTVIGTHLIRPPHMNSQMRQLDTLARLVRSQTGPVIAAGDFNATPWSYMLKNFIAASGLRSVIGSAPTWPVGHANLAQIPIDHIFVSPNLKALSAGTGPRLGSDHLPVVGTIQLPGS